MSLGGPGNDPDNYWLEVTKDQVSWRDWQVSFRGGRTSPILEMVHATVRRFGAHVNLVGSYPFSTADIPRERGCIDFACKANDTKCVMGPTFELYEDYVNMCGRSRFHSATWPPRPTGASYPYAMNVSEPSLPARTWEVLTLLDTGPAFHDRKPQAYLAGVCHAPKKKYFDVAAQQRARPCGGYADADLFVGPPHFLVECSKTEAFRFAPIIRQVPAPWAKHLDYKYLVYVPGNGRAPRGELFWLLASGSVVLALYPFVYHSFYFSLLEPWVHFVPFSDESEIGDLVEQLNADASKSLRIASNSRTLVRELARESVWSWYVASAMLVSKGKPPLPVPQNNGTMS